MIAINRVSRVLLTSAITLLAASLCLAAYSDLVCTVQDVAGDTVSVSVHNPTASPETARVRMTVRLVGGNSETLTSGNVTVSSSATSSVEVRASQSISVILEGPEPISPL